jgi:hypothetical protein
MKRTMALIIALILISIPIAYADTGGGGVTIDLTPIVQVVIALLATIITAKVVPWLRAKLTAEQYATLTAVTKTLVYAAEQIYGANRGSDKIDYVVRQLQRRGYTVDRDAIEAQVRELTLDQQAVKAISEERPPDGGE